MPVKVKEEPETYGKSSIYVEDRPDGDGVNIRSEDADGHSWYIGCITDEGILELYQSVGDPNIETDDMGVIALKYGSDEYTIH